MNFATAIGTQERSRVGHWLTGINSIPPNMLEPIARVLQLDEQQQKRLTYALLPGLDSDWRNSRPAIYHASDLLLAYRNLRGHTQQELADILNQTSGLRIIGKRGRRELDKTKVSAWESMQRGIPTEYTEPLIKALDIPSVDAATFRSAMQQQSLNLLIHPPGREPLHFEPVAGAETVGEALQKFEASVASLTKEGVLLAHTPIEWRLGAFTRIHTQQHDQAAAMADKLGKALKAYGLDAKVIGDAFNRGQASGREAGFQALHALAQEQRLPLGPSFLDELRANPAGTIRALPGVSMTPGAFVGPPSATPARGAPAAGASRVPAPQRIGGR